MKNKMIKTQHNSLFTLTKRWFGDSILKIKQGSLKKTKLNFQLLLQLKISSPHFFHYDQQVSSLKVLISMRYFSNVTTYVPG